MPSRPKVMKVVRVTETRRNELTETELTDKEDLFNEVHLGWTVVIKIKGVKTADFSSPVARRAKLKAAREVGILADYVPSSLEDVRDLDIDKAMDGKFFGEITERKVLDKTYGQQTVLYGIEIRNE